MKPQNRGHTLGSLWCRARRWMRTLSQAGAVISLLTVTPVFSAALQQIHPDVWWLPGVINASGEADAANRGQVSNVLVVRDGARIWLLGSGPTARAGRELGEAVQRQLGQAVTDVIAPWPHPELVLGQAGLDGVRRWAHADVAQTMRQRCPHCVARLSQRLGDAAADLGPQPIRLPQQLLQGDSGQLGPWRWWRLWRATSATETGATPVTVWWHAASGLFSAHGLLWGDQAPDLRDTRWADLQAATEQLVQISAPLASPTPLRWLPEQGTLLPADAPTQQLTYGKALAAAVRRAQNEGRAETDAPLPLPGIPAAQQSGVRHHLNWQRLWRELEQEWFDQPTAFQRSLR